MTRPSLAGIEQRAAAATPEPWFQGRNGRPYEGTCDVYSRREPDEPDSHDIATYVHSEDDAAFIAHARTDVEALTAAVRDVLAMHAEATCSRGYPQAFCIDCDQVWPCATVRALAARLDLTDPEGDPT